MDPWMVASWKGLVMDDGSGFSGEAERLSPRPSLRARARLSPPHQPALRSPGPVTGSPRKHPL